ncbi:MAG: prepilin-type N-terminal cleavage/methylation domain-containing protein [bacterium]|nr:prepilin-type N-terminal cleavage/methylation domain-containing protein [bacterium]
MKTSLGDESGFSLVELAVVLVIIGLIVGGVLKGQELIESARLKAVLSQVNEFRVAAGTFLDRYGDLPGDYEQASRYIDEGLRDGNGDGMISGSGLEVSDGEEHESLSFWAHLTGAHLMPSPGKAPDNGNATFGKGAPKARIGGGFTIVHNPHPSMPGHWFVLGSENGASGDGALLTPLQAMGLNRQADDGNPTTGRIRSRDGEGAEPQSCVDAEGRYATGDQKACVLYFQM